MTFVSYSQNFEDVMLWRALKHIERGFYIDVGAFSPDVDSVTRAFSERGWRGINIEPNPDYLAQLKARRPHDVNLGIALSDAEGMARLKIVGDTGLTTTEADIADMHAEAGWPVRSIDVPARTLAAVWNEYVLPGQEVHFLKVDVEGHEAAVLRGSDWSRHRPWIVVVEATLPRTPIPAFADWDGILEDAGYRFIYWDGLNRFYLAQERAELADRFTAPPNVFDDFVVSRTGVAVESIAALRESLTKLDADVQLLDAKVGHATHLVATLAAELAADQAERRHTQHSAWVAFDRIDYVLNRSFLERLVNRRSGKPRRPFRVLFFHRSGKPRGLFRRVVLHRNGTPRTIFARWMNSPAYLALRYPSRRQGHALQMPALTSAPKGSAALTPRERYFTGRLAAEAASGRKAR